jgi:hypothetical protein
VDEIPGTGIMTHAVDHKGGLPFDHIKIFFHPVMDVGTEGLPRLHPDEAEVEPRPVDEILGPAVAVAVFAVFFMNKFHD